MRNFHLNLRLNRKKMNNWFRKAGAMGCLLLCFALPGHTSLLNENAPLHPRVLVKAAAVPDLREKMKKAPFSEKLEALKSSCTERQSLLQENDKLYDIVELAADLAGVYLLTGDALWAEKSYQAVEIVLNDTLYFRNPVSRGLTRAALLMRTAIAYDFCYTAWNDQQRHQVNEALYEVMVATNANMGTEANYSIASNWMGVRFGAVIIANLAIDHKTQRMIKAFSMGCYQSTGGAYRTEFLQQRMEWRKSGLLRLRLQLQRTGTACLEKQFVKLSDI
jgi:hypothetical protein